MSELTDTNTITQFYQVGFKSGVMSVLTVPILPQPIGNKGVLHMKGLNRM